MTVNASIVKWILFFTAVLSAALSVAHAQTPGAGYNNRSFQYLSSSLTSSAPTSNSTSTWSSVTIPKFYSVSVTTASSGAFNVALEGSLDNSNWRTIAITSSATGMTSNLFPVPAIYLRLRAHSIAAGLTVTGTAVGSL